MTPEEYSLKLKEIEEQSKNHRLSTWATSVVTAIVVATIGAVGSIYVQKLSGENQIELENLKNQVIEKEIIIKKIDQNRQITSDFATHALNKDYQYRVDFAEYVYRTIDDQDVSQKWKMYHEFLSAQLIEKTDKFNNIRAEIIDLQEKIASGSQETNLDNRLLEKTNELRGLVDQIYPMRQSVESSISATSVQKSSVSDFNRDDFQALIGRAGLSHIKADEMLVLGSQHHLPGSPGFGLNSFPPRELWANGVALAKVLDLARTRFGKPIRIIATYRSPAYSSAINASGKSTHMKFLAADIEPMEGSVDDIHGVFKIMRNEGIFKGGIGKYPNFVHIDIRGSDADWGGTTEPGVNPMNLDDR